MKKFNTIKLPDAIKSKVELYVVKLDQYFAIATVTARYVADDVTGKYFIITTKTQAEAEQRLAEIKQEMAKTGKGKK